MNIVPRISADGTKTYFTLEWGRGWASYIVFPWDDKGSQLLHEFNYWRCYYFIIYQYFIAANFHLEIHSGAAAGIYSIFQQTASALGISIIGGIFFYFSRNGWQAAYHASIIAILLCTAIVGLMLV